jgi:U2-associated protein SR140
MVFGRYGPIASIKIMWPRTAEEFARGHNSGFVSFMHREDAHAAFQNLHETDIDGHVVRLTWGRAQARSRHPMPPLPGQKYGNNVKRFGADVAMERADPRLPAVLVQPPLDLVRRQDINRLARNVMQQGENAQNYLASIVADEQGAGNSRFTFLWDPDEFESDDGVYYRWRLYSLEHGDSDRRWRTAPFAMVDGGPLWSPPPCLCPMNNPPVLSEAGSVVPTTEHGGTGVDSDEEPNIHMRVGNGSLQVELSSLSQIARELATLDEQLDEAECFAFASILHSLDTRRGSIGQAMVFCMDRSRCAGSVLSQILTAIVREPVSGEGRTRHLSLLFLVSDILCNSGEATVPRASVYRMRLERVLPALFCVLGLWFKQIDGRITAHKVAVAAEAVLTHWTRISLFSAEFTAALRSELFTGQDATGVVAQAVQDASSAWNE